VEEVPAPVSSLITAAVADELAGTSHGVMLLLWSDTDQCDWFLSGRDDAALRAGVGRIVGLSDLRTSLFSTDVGAEALLARLRESAAPPGPDGA